MLKVGIERISPIEALAVQEDGCRFTTLLPQRGQVVAGWFFEGDFRFPVMWNLEVVHRQV